MRKRVKRVPIPVAGSGIAQPEKQIKVLSAVDVEIAVLEQLLREARARQATADAAAMELCDRILEAVKAEEGEDSELYAVMLFAGLRTHGCH